LSYDLHGGFSSAKSYDLMKKNMPKSMRPKADGVFASSPGVLNIEVQTPLAARAEKAIRAVRAADVAEAIRVLRTWCRGDPKDIAPIESAESDLKALCAFIDVDFESLVPVVRKNTKEEIIVATKLVLFYCNRLVRLANGVRGVISARFLGEEPQLSDSHDDDIEF
jgi:hypothetical protein